MELISNSRHLLQSRLLFNLDISLISTLNIYSTFMISRKSQLPMFIRDRLLIETSEYWFSVENYSLMQFSLQYFCDIIGPCTMDNEWKKSCDMNLLEQFQKNTPYCPTIVLLFEQIVFSFLNYIIIFVFQQTFILQMAKMELGQIYSVCKVVQIFDVLYKNI